MKKFYKAFASLLAIACFTGNLTTVQGEAISKQNRNSGLIQSL